MGQLILPGLEPTPPQPLPNLRSRVTGGPGCGESPGPGRIPTAPQGKELKLDQFYHYS